MAIVKDNILMQLVRGTLGKHYIIYERNGQIIMAVKRGPSRKKPTQKQGTLSAIPAYSSICQHRLF
ncbi:hypothetical protein SAMN04488121_102584 [Chitinophaga filiformis]|uniref:Uncharacterized protein n=1 Tax=Chitinophaga filiformis TaxID=104663 RepID=A0A1G7MX08_CHIFI|nr:hypothetical protein SAMN04488121_102584 [Chitinophaga filiformis]